MATIFKHSFPLIVLCVLIIMFACGRPIINDTSAQSKQMIFTENINYERQNFIAKDFPDTLQFINEESINGTTTPNIGYYKNHLFLTTLNGYLSIIPFHNIGKNRKTRLSKGSIAAPTLYGNKLYIPMITGSSGLQVYDIITGQVSWELKGSYSRSSPIVVKDLVYHIDQQGSILCLNSEFGDQVWRADINDKIYTNLIYAHEYLIAVSQNGRIQIYDPSSGLLNLTHDLNIPIYAQSIAVNQFVYIISYKGILYNLNLKTGKILKIQDYNEKSYSSLSSDGQKLLIPLSDGKLVCRDFLKNSDIWTVQVEGPASCPVLVTNNHVIIATSQKLVYILNKDDGTINQILETEGRISAPPIIDGNKIILCYEYDKIALYGSTGENNNVTIQE